MIRVLVGSSDSLAAAGLRALLAAEQGLELVAQGVGPAQMARLAGIHQPDVIVFDAVNTNEAADLLSRLTGESIKLPVVLAGSSASAASIARGFRLGARGYVDRGANAEEIAAVVRAVADGLITVPPPAMDLLLQPFRAAIVDGLATETAEEPLTAREREVLELLAQGLANKQIAQRLSISEHTVKYHVGEVMAKLNAASRTEAVTRAARRGLLVL